NGETVRFNFQTAAKPAPPSLLFVRRGMRFQRDPHAAAAGTSGASTFLARRAGLRLRAATGRGAALRLRDAGTTTASTILALLAPASPRSRPERSSIAPSMPISNAVAMLVLG